MKFNYKLHRLCGASYGCPGATQSSLGSSSSSSSIGGNLVYDSTGNVLLSPVSNRVQIVDLLSHAVRTLSVQARSNIRTLTLSPDDRLLVIFDVDDYCCVVNYRRGVVLHRMKFPRRVRDAKFSPVDGRYLAVTHGKNVRVWRSPGLVREAAPLSLHRTYGGMGDDVLHLDWSSDATALLGCGRDGTAKVWTVDTVKDYVPATLSGHKSAVVGGWFEPPKRALLGGGERGNRLRTIYTVSGDGAVVQWKCSYDDEGGDADGSSSSMMPALSDSAVDFFSGGAAPTPSLPASSSDFASRTTQAHHLVKGTWSVHARHYFNQGFQTTVTSCAYNPASSLLSAGFSSGLFGLYELPSMAAVHTLSISNSRIRTVAMNPTGEWLAFGCPAAQQLLVWEWRSEQHVLKQRGHAYGMRCASYSPDGAACATGGEDGTIKLWNTASGFCYCTLSNHTAPVTAVTFANASVVLSASLDGTVRAHDLHRYRNFRTLTTPSGQSPPQFISVAVDPAGEIVSAGSSDPFHVYVWDLRSGKVLDVLTGHAAPVCGLMFHPLRGTLASGSWDGTVKIWDLYKRETDPETLTHGTDVACLAFRPDGKRVCTGTVGGLLSFWNVDNGALVGEIDGRRDVAGGRKMNDRTASNNNASSRYFTSVCYSADGSCVLAGGNSKYVCIYEVDQGVLLKKFQISFNRSLDGVLDELNSKNLGEGGPLDDRDGSDDEADFSSGRLPGAKRGDDGSRSTRVEVLTTSVAFSPTGREWSAVSGEGLHVYSLDDDMIFDPIALTEAVTPSAVQSKLRQREWGVALRMSLHLNETGLIRNVVEDTPHESIGDSARCAGHGEALERLLRFCAAEMSDSVHVEFYLRWCLELLRAHGAHVEKHRGTFLRALRAMHRAVAARYDEVKRVCDENGYTLDFLEDQANLILNR